MEDTVTQGHAHGSQLQQDPVISNTSIRLQHSARATSFSSKSTPSQHSTHRTTVESRPTSRDKLPILDVDKLVTILGSAPTRSPTHRAPMRQIKDKVKEHQAGTKFPAINSITTGGVLITSPQKRHRKTWTAFWVRSSSTPPQQQYCLIVVLHILLLLRSLQKNVV